MRPQAERLTQPELASVRPRSGSEPSPRRPSLPPRSVEIDSTVAALRRQLAAAQHDLAAAQHRLAKEQDGRVEDAERLSEVTAQLETERQTSHWLRSAGEQATREIATLRAREREDDNVTRARTELAEREQASAKDANAQLRAMAERLSRATAEIDTLRAENETLTQGLAQSHARTIATAEQLEPATEILVALNRSLDALARADEQIFALREETAASRRAIAEQAAALRQTMGRASEATVTAGRPRTAPPSERHTDA